MYSYNDLLGPTYVYLGGKYVHAVYKQYRYIRRAKMYQSTRTCQKQSIFRLTPAGLTVLNCPNYSLHKIPQSFQNITFVIFQASQNVIFHCLKKVVKSHGSEKCSFRHPKSAKSFPLVRQTLSPEIGWDGELEGLESGDSRPHGELLLFQENQGPATSQ